MLAGCAGSSANLSSPSPIGQGVQLGNANIKYQGSAKPYVLDGENGLTASSLGGVTLADFMVEPAQTNGSTTLAFIGPNEGIETYQRGVESPGLDSTGQVIQGCAFGHDGHLYYGMITAADSPEIAKSFYDGTGLTVLHTFSGEMLNDLCLTPNSATLVGCSTLTGLFTMPAGGGALTTLDSAGIEPCVTPDGKTVIYSKTVASYNQLFKIPIGGGTPTQLTNDPTNKFYPTCSPDGLLVLADEDTGAYRLIASYVLTTPNTGYLFQVYTSPSGYASHAALSPDEKYLAYSYSTSYSDPTLSVYVQDLGNNSSEFIGQGSKPEWSPYPYNRTFVGSGGAMFTSAAGFIYTQQNGGFAGLVSFTATTPSSSTVTLDSRAGAAGGPLVYVVYADDVTSLKYTTAYFDSPVVVTPNTHDVLVTIDYTSGQVTSVSPFVATRGSALKATNTPSGARYAAKFTAVYDAHGKNLAPSGASAIILNPKSGAVSTE